MATVSTPQASNQSAKACKSGVKVGNGRTETSSRPSGTHAHIPAAPMSHPAALRLICLRLSNFTTLDFLRFLPFLLCLVIIALNLSLVHLFWFRPDYLVYM